MLLVSAKKKELAAALRDTNFAIQIDESTDISRDKGLAVIVRFPDPDTGHTVNSKLQ